MDLLSEKVLQELLLLVFQLVLGGRASDHLFKDLIGGAFQAIDKEESRERLLTTISADWSKNDSIRFLLLLPFCSNTWKLVDMLSKAVQNEYWAGASPDWFYQTDEEKIEGSERLMKAGRPYAAFSGISFLHRKKLDVQVLFRLLSDIATSGEDRADEYRLKPHNIEEAFKYLNKSPMLTSDQKVRLEFDFITVLAPPMGRRADNYGIPNLERHIEDHPELFVEAIVWAFKRRDNAEDPAPYQVPPDCQEIMAKRSNLLLQAIERIPGQDDFSDLKAHRLREWVTKVRQLCIGLNRIEVADTCIGELLSHAPVGQDGIWPCEPVRQVMEESASEPMMRGAFTGVYNSRGVFWRGESGDQERELAAKYRKWAHAIQVSYPFVASKLLMELARTYEAEGFDNDLEAGIHRRLR